MTTSTPSAGTGVVVVVVLVSSGAEPDEETVGPALQADKSKARLTPPRVTA
jgi:hypothetical protein